MTHWKTQFNYDYLGAYSLPGWKRYNSHHPRNEKRTSSRRVWKERRMFRRLFLRKCETDDPQPDELQNIDENFQESEF